MVEGGEDKISAAITAVSSGEMDGGDTVNEVTLETALNAPETAINSIITALEIAGILADN